uniref:Cytochrome c oxidase assembly protein COX20, mitochondrial n=1 Tax=Chrysotila carterae TaxID=13221 RepID=A0A7S4B0F3_CHRCT
MAAPDEPAAVVVNDEDREQAKRETRWKALMTFHHAPCLAQSVGLGVAGGTSIGVLRYLTSKQPMNALNWGAVVGGLLYGSTWFVCRRAMYKSIEEEAKLLSGVAQNDAAAIREYAKRVHERQQQKKADA